MSDANQNGTQDPNQKPPTPSAPTPPLPNPGEPRRIADQFAAPTSGAPKKSPGNGNPRPSAETDGGTRKDKKANPPSKKRSLGEKNSAGGKKPPQDARRDRPRREAQPSRGGPKSASDAIGGGRSKEDRQRERAAAVGGAAARSAGLGKNDQQLAEGAGRDLADVKNAQGAANKAKAAYGAAEKGGRMVLNKKTGGISEKVLKTKPGQVVLKVVRVAAVANVVLPLLLVSAIVLSAVVVIASFTGSEGVRGDYEYALDSTHPMHVPDSYLDAYENAAARHDVPWTILAGVGQIATEHGRYAPSDITDYGMIVDRAPQLPPIGSMPGAALPSKNSPPAGSQVVVVGDSFVDGIKVHTTKNLASYDVSYASSTGATIADLGPGIEGAVAQGAAVLVIQAGVNDIYQSKSEEVYRAEMVDILDKTASTTCVVWVNLQTFYNETYANLGPAALRFNQVLAEEIATRPWASIADLATATAVAGMQAPDGLHLTPSGYRAWADVVARTVLGCVTANPAETTADGSEGYQTLTGEPVKVDSTYGTNICTDDICGPFPRMGEAEGTPLGPLQLKRDWVKENAAGRSPDDIADAADMLAQALAETRDSVLNTQAADLFYDWQSDPAAATEFWSYVVAQAPIVLPVSNGLSKECGAGPIAGPQGATLSWPVAAPVSLGEFGAGDSADGMVQVAGMELQGESSEVYAAGTGTVSDAGSDSLGAYVVVAHGEGFTTRYHRLITTAAVVGDQVSSGTVLGTYATSLLFQTTISGSPRNPRLYVADAASLPLAAGVATDPQAGSGTVDDPQSGVPIDPCTGLRIVPALTTSTANTSSGSSISIPGSLVIPVAGFPADRLRDSFGDPRSGGRKHEGIDIVVPIGTPLLAVTNATVLRDDAGGQPCPSTGDPGKGVTLIDATGNHFYYGHMDTVLVQKNQQVSAGQLIGTVGETGNACVTTPHLHFSINENTDKVVNPYPILSGARSLEISDFASALGADAIAALMGSAALSGAAEFAVGFAVFYGGIVPSDPRAGTFPGTPTGFADTDGVSGAEIAANSPEIAAIIREHFPPEQWDNALRVAQCESGLNPRALNENNGNGSSDYGLFQLNDRSVLPGLLSTFGEDPRNLDKAFDPHWNARVTAHKVAYDTNWGQWTCGHTLGIVSVSPRQLETGQIDYNWQEPGPGDTSVNFSSPSTP